MSSPSDGPFTGESVEGVPLENAPLVRVFCQVQWPEQTLLSASYPSISDEIAIALSGDYPIRTAAAPTGLEFDAQSGQVRPQSSPASRQWSSLDDAWSVYFTPTFVTLENRGNYTSRDDMVDRFRRILGEVERAAQIPAIQRVGWRYVNRLSDADDLLNLPSLVHEGVLGARSIPVSDGVVLQHSLSDALFQGPDGNLGAKWGVLPSGGAYDAGIPPAQATSWFLDLDAYSDRRAPFLVAQVVEQVAGLSNFAYSFFRWAVKDEFIDRFGGRK